MLDEGCVEQFLRCHLPRCDCPRWAPRTPSDAHAAMVPMLEILRVEGVIALVVSRQVGVGPQPGEG
jgi:hypothetical protein